MDKAQLIRFVLDPDGCVVPDIDLKLPGRGMWVRADRTLIDAAVAKNLFARAARASARVSPDLSGRVESLLSDRILGLLGLTCRSGGLITGFERVSAAIAASAAAVVIEASDGAAHGREKILKRLRATGRECPILGCFSAEELGLAIGRDNVVHAAVKPGGLAERVKVQMTRLAGFRPLCPTPWTSTTKDTL